jgi:hypothetical protein
VSEAISLCPTLTVIPKKKRFNKPESRMIREANYALRNALVKWASNHLIIQMNQRFMVNIELSGSDEFFLDLTPLVDAAIRQGLLASLPADNRVFYECR